MERATINENKTLSSSLGTGPNVRSGRFQHGYSSYLTEQDIPFSVAELYLISGNPAEDDRWLIHITVVRQQFESLIRPLLTLLKAVGTPFVIPVNTEQHQSLLEGRSGFVLTGKVITVCIDPNKEPFSLTNELCELTKNIIGPGIPCAYQLTNVIAVEYGVLFGQNYTLSARQPVFYGSGIAKELRQQLKRRQMKWPFGAIRPLINDRQPRLLGRQYLPIEFYKKDPKGNVFKALELKMLYNAQWCVIKQGRQYQSYDHAGRDAKDRLRWQFQVHQDLAGHRILPKPIAYFESGGDGFFVMEYQESMSLTEKAIHLSEGRIWRSMPTENKREMISYLLQIVDILSLFHQQGFVHRDVTAANFIVTGSGQVLAIDIELCYDFRHNVPDPPFALGTPGYMSPAQQACELPATGDDIYSFGALLISVLTGILPNKFNPTSVGALKKNLSYFIESATLVTTIAACLSLDTVPPSLADIRSALEVYDAVLLTSSEAVAPPCPDVQPDILGLLFPQGLQLPTYERPLWDQDLPVNQSDANANTKTLGVSIPPLPDKSPVIPAGISRGLAGRGLQLWYRQNQSPTPAALKQLKELASRILTLQQADGSWVTTPHPANKKSHRVIGFSHGVAGVAYFLLCFYAQNPSPDLFGRIEKALRWLIQQRRPDRGRSTWPVSAENHTFDPWLEHGFSGVALTLIKAYEVLGNIEYKQIASEVLAYHPMHITSNYFSFGNGLAGLGEIYLEAFKVFQEPDWQDRAQSVREVLLHSCYQDKDACYWLDGTQLHPSPDFWTGNDGIKHFLLRYQHPKEINFPYQLIP